MYNNIKKVRQHFKLNQEIFGKCLGVTGAAVSRLENGTRNPSEQIILAICREFNVNEKWLRTGEGEMFLPKVEDSLIEYLTSKGASKKIQAFIIAYLSLPQNYKEAIDNYIDRVYEEMQKIDEIEELKIDLTRPDGLSDSEWDMIVKKRTAEVGQKKAAS